MGGAAWRLTASTQDSRAPFWSRDGQALIYSVAGFDHLPPMPGVLVSVPFQGGPSSVLLPKVQSHGARQRWLVAPAPSPVDETLAYVEIWQYFDPQVCTVGTITCSPADNSAAARPERAPRLGAVMIRQRELGVAHPVETDPEVLVRFEGRRFDTSEQPFDLHGVWKIDYHPFQNLFEQEETYFFRPSWAPDGSALAISDGLSIQIWDPTSGALTMLPDTEDGVSPAWSPDGEWIAFARLERGEPETCRCIHMAALGPTCVQDRTEWGLGDRFITVVRPGGAGDENDVHTLVRGDEPAWAPDGRTLFIVHDGAIWWTDIDGSVPRRVPGTENGREPAVSPDGRYLAFVRRGATPGSFAEPFQLWVLDLTEVPEH